MDYQQNILKQECYSTKIETEFPEGLRLLEEFNRIKIQDQTFLKDVSVLFIQHHLAPFIGRLKQMKNNGMMPNATWFVDIPYSSNEKVISKIKNEFTSYDFPNQYKDPLDNYTKSQLERVKSTVREIIESNPSKILVVDDGAYFIRALHDIFISDAETLYSLQNKVYIVEQTTRGHRYLKSKKYQTIIEILNSPVVSIARSNTKLDIESPFIGIACIKSIERNQRIRSKLKSNKNLNIGIIGFGAIGEAVLQSVRKIAMKNKRMDVIEIDYTKWADIEKAGGNPISDFNKNKYDILFGCTGYKSFGWNDRIKVNNDGLLVSVSSASIEFSRQNFIEFANLYPDDPIEIEIAEPEKGIHSDLLFKNVDSRFYFINGGFPVNFTGERECLPLKFIQPTHALLYAASYQVLNQPRPGVHPLLDEYDYWIYYNAFYYN